MSFTNDQVYTKGVAVTLSDTTEISAKALWVGGAGALSLITESGDTVLISGIPAGTLLPISCRSVRSTGSTATLVIALT
jgi:hypothetical protein